MFAPAINFPFQLLFPKWYFEHAAVAINKMTANN
jgi:hypothetical protein